LSIVVVEAEIVIATTVHQSKFMLFDVRFVMVQMIDLSERFSAELTEALLS
jgi:hypothetical protein